MQTHSEYREHYHSPTDQYEYEPSDREWFETLLRTYPSLIEPRNLPAAYIRVCSALHRELRYCLRLSCARRVRSRVGLWPCYRPGNPSLLLLNIAILRFVCTDRRKHRDTLTIITQALRAS